MEPPPELDELMERIRRAANPPLKGEPEVGQVPPMVPEALPPPPPLISSIAPPIDRTALETALSEAASMLPRAGRKNEVGLAVPGMLRSLYRNQGGFNGILLEACGQMLEANRLLQRQNIQLQERMEALENSVVRQQEWAVAASGAFDQQREWMLSIGACLRELEESKAELERRFRERAAEAQATSVPAPIIEFNDELLAKLEGQVAEVDGHANRLGDHLRNLQTQVDDQGTRHADWHEQYRQATAMHDTMAQNAQRVEERQHNDSSYFKNQLWYLQRLVEPLLTRTGGIGTTGENEAPSPPVSDEHELDALYLAFEEVMRGSRAEVKDRTEIYLPTISNANAGTAARPILDVGCGRGEWLEILGERGLIASGVDLNVCMVELCRERGLPVQQLDALTHLQGMPDASCGAITAFHFIEHLPFPVLVRFLRHCRRVLQPGGVAIFETPNPYNVLVGSGMFYHDFTHQRPLPPTSTKFLVEQMGFARVEILPLHPWDEAAKVHGDGAKALEWRFNELFYGPQDYAVIATP